MTFQYFFFDTYPGYFLEALPIALVVTALWYVLRYRKDRATPAVQKVWKCVFVCYMTGLVCLVIFLYVMMNGWYRLLYHRDGGMGIPLLSGEFDFGLDFYRYRNGEVMGNFLMFLPFGVLYPLSHPNSGFRKTILAGFVSIAVMEVLQPVFGRSFDVNDIVVDTLAVALSAAAFFLVKRAVRK